MQRPVRHLSDGISAWPLRWLCALCAMLLLVGAATAQEGMDENAWQPRFQNPIVAESWDAERPLNVLEPLPFNDTGIVAQVGHQEPLPRPEGPPEPIPSDEANLLQPVPNQYLVTPSCATCGGCNRCGGCNLCEPCTANTRLGRFACALVDAVCCPDPCYEPRWTGIANAAFWVDGARPVTQVRYRWDAAYGLELPDRASFVWPQVGAVGPATAPSSMNLHELSIYNEVAHGGFSFFINTPYRSFNTDADFHAAGFGDMDLGTKSVLFDCELLQITFQMRTFIPLGNPIKGLGTEHATLEPSILMALNISPDTYLQAQFSEWIPLTSAPGAGAILHYHTSLNQVLFRWQPSVPIIGTLEANGWSFQDGSYTDPTGTVYPASGTTYVSAGPGLRVVVCDRVDFGIGSAFAVTDDHWGQQSIRSEFRWRF